jgi:lysophospholipase L1-like esterase
MIGLLDVLGDSFVAAGKPEQVVMISCGSERRRSVRVGLIALVLVFAAGCSSGSSPGSQGTLEPSATQWSSVAESSQATSPSASLSFVGLGDSLPGGAGCGCTGYVELYGKAAASSLATAVRVTNLATNDGVDSGQLLARIRSDQTYRDALTSADLISVQIGFNDWRVCNWPNDDACWENGSAVVEQNLSATLEELGTLRGGKRTALRILTYPNMFIGALTSPQPPFLGDSSFQRFYKGQLDQLNAAICRAAEANGAACVDLVAAFNGPAGDAAPIDLIGPDNKHPTAAGHQLIAKTLDAAGYEPLA